MQVFKAFALDISNVLRWESSVSTFKHLVKEFLMYDYIKESRQRFRNELERNQETRISCLNFEKMINSGLCVQIAYEVLVIISNQLMLGLWTYTILMKLRKHFFFYSVHSKLLNVKYVYDHVEISIVHCFLWLSWGIAFILMKIALSLGFASHTSNLLPWWPWTSFLLCLRVHFIWGMDNSELISNCED